MANASFFNNYDCEYMPCHEGIEPADINCLFCFCPLYNLESCPGKPTILSDGIKDCSSCTYPHKAEHYMGVINTLRKKEKV